MQKVCVRVCIFSVVVGLWMGVTECNAGESHSAIQTAAQLRAELRDCAGSNARISAVIRSVIDEDLSGWDLVLDVLYPQSIGEDEISESRISEVLGRLGSHDYAICREAVSELYNLGPQAKVVLDKMRTPLDPVERIWLKGVIACWEDEKIPNLSQCLWSLEQIIKEEKNKNAMDLLAARALQAIQNNDTGLTDPRRVGYRYPQSATKVIIGMLARAGDDKYSEMFLPVLDHPDIGTAAQVVQAFGRGRDNRYFPPILLEALRHHRPEIVDVAIRSTPNCWDRRRSSEVGRLLREIFNGSNEELKFHACFPLMHSGYAKKEAIEYLLEQTQSSDIKRMQRAISWLGDSCNSRKKPWPGLMENLVPYLESEDQGTRRRAADALGTYAGREIVRVLIPMLADEEEIIVNETRVNLLGQVDKEMLRSELKMALETCTNEILRERIVGLLDSMNEKSDHVETRWEAKDKPIIISLR